MGLSLLGLFSWSLSRLEYFSRARHTCRRASWGCQPSRSTSPPAGRSTRSSASKTSGTPAIAKNGGKLKKWWEIQNFGGKFKFSAVRIAGHHRGRRATGTRGTSWSTGWVCQASGWLRWSWIPASGSGFPSQWSRAHIPSGFESVLEDKRKKWRKKKMVKVMSTNSATF